MKSFAVTNFRSLIDTKPVEIKNLNLFVGSNSSGKSTLLRFFPLLKQSSELNKTSPILWYGRLADFGSFKETVYMNNENETISIDFNIPAKSLYRMSEFKFRRRNYRNRRQSFFSSEHEIKLSITLASNKGYTYSKKVAISFENRHIEITFNNNIAQVTINGKDYFSEKSKIFSEQGHILPKIDLISNMRRQEKPPFRDILKTHISSTHKNIKNHILDEIIDTILSFETENALLEKIKESKKYNTTWDTYLTPVNKKYNKIDTLLNLIYLEHLPDLLSLLDDYLNFFSMNIRYIEPLRATAERYYRFQELSVDEVDSRGQNLPIFLKNLSKTEMDEFQAWTTNGFGFYATAKTEGGHFYINITDINTEKETNLTDTGFGYSQILPVITQLWHLSRRDIKRTRSVRRSLQGSTPFLLAIEQPELHLHPKLQALFIDAVVYSLKQAIGNNIDLRIIIETHSEVIINRIGQHIRQMNITNNDTNVILFNKLKHTTSLEQANYNTEGVLTNWPYDFFLPKMIPDYSKDV